MKRLLSFIILIIYVGLVSCSSAKETKEVAKSSNLITTSSGLQYQDLVVGTGETPTTGKNCIVHYHGTLENGTVFDSSVERNSPFAFPIGVGRVIKGWDEGVMSMKVGGKRKLIIPANLAYGERAMGKIPANSTLIFEVELLEIK